MGKEGGNSVSSSKGLLGMFGAALPQLKGGKVGKSRAKPKPLTSQTSLARKSGTSLASKAMKPGAIVRIQESSTDADAISKEISMSLDQKPRRRRRKRLSHRVPEGRLITMKDTTVEKRVELAVAGFPQGTEQELIQYLKTMSRKEWEPKDLKIDGGEMFLAVSDPVVARSILRLHGYVFQAHTLQIRLANEIGFKPTDEPTTGVRTTIDTLRLFLRSRWFSSHKLLKLDKMASDPILVQAGVHPPGSPLANEFTGAALFKLAREMFGHVVSLSLASNSLRNVQSVSIMSQFLPELENLSLGDNAIQDVAGLEALSGTGKLPHLRELVLAGNPICKGSEENTYRRDVAKRFPGITVIDGLSPSVHAVATPKTSTMLLMHTKPSVFDSDTTRATAFDFLFRYFVRYDSRQGRSDLGMLYDPNACFSVSSQLKLRNKVRMRRRDRKKIMDDDQAEVAWESLKRNLATASQAHAGKGIYRGQEAIQTMLNRLPATKHNLSKQHDFLIDAHQSPIGLVIQMHGEFKQGDDDHTPPYSFDRTFILRPSPPTSSATAAGCPYCIVSDMLTLRDYVDLCRLQPQIAAAKSAFAVISSHTPSSGQP